MRRGRVTRRRGKGWGGRFVVDVCTYGIAGAGEDEYDAAIIWCWMGGRESHTRRLREAVVVIPAIKHT
jgi:hypothetical protein